MLGPDVSGGHVQRKSPRVRGFTLIEITIVVVIMGVLAAIAYPMFSKYQCRAKQTEASSGLKTLYMAQDSYRGRNDNYVDAAAAPAILYPILMGYGRYTFPIVSADAVSFLARAEGRMGIDMQGDLWTVNEHFQLVNLTPNHCQ